MLYKGGKGVRGSSVMSTKSTMEDIMDEILDRVVLEKWRWKRGGGEVKEKRRWRRGYI